jgi:hypothetical protein
MEAKGNSMMKDDDKQPVGRGDTNRQQGQTQQRVPRRPDERDESADSQASDEPSQRRMGELGRNDVESGKVDTGKGPVLRDLHENKI